VPTGKVGKSTLYFSDLFRLVLIFTLRYTVHMYIYCTRDLQFQIGSQFTSNAPRIRYVAFANELA